MVVEGTFVVERQNLDVLVKEIFADMRGGSTYALVGPLGVGKTTIVATLLKNLGVVEPVTSPTFTYMNQYKTAGGIIVYHFDLYRLMSLEDFQQAGFEEYFGQPNSIVFVEWPEVIIDWLCAISATNQVMLVFLSYDVDDMGRRYCRTKRLEASARPW
jgi:tRNA threonylcarbamoyladenosine biosynthesis protein TsaE